MKKYTINVNNIPESNDARALVGPSVIFSFVHLDIPVQEMIKEYRRRLQKANVDASH